MRGWTVLAIALALLACGCGAATEPAGDAPAVSAPVARTVADQQDARTIEVYTAVLRHHLTSWNSGDPRPSVVYLLDRAAPNAADPMRSLADRSGEPIGADLQSQLITALADLAPLRFIASSDAVITTPNSCPAVVNDGALITLAPVPDGAQRLSVGLADFRACLGARWLTYAVAYTTSGWTVEGTIGPVTIA
jgi:hypothetical protein